MELGPAKLFTKIRQENKMTQVQMAKKLGVNQSTIARIEEGANRPNGKLIDRLEAFTKKSLEEMLSELEFHPARSTKTSCNPKQAHIKPLSELSAGMLDYLRNKWSAQIIELNKKIERQLIKLKKLGDKKLFYEFEVNSLAKKLETSTKTLEHLKNTHAPQETIDSIEEECQELSKLLDERQSLLDEFNDADAYLRILKVKELEQAVALRQSFLKDMGS